MQQVFFLFNQHIYYICSATPRPLVKLKHTGSNVTISKNYVQKNKPTV